MVCTLNPPAPSPLPRLGWPLLPMCALAGLLAAPSARAEPPVAVTPPAAATPVTTGETPSPPAQPVTMGEAPVPPAQPVDPAERLRALSYRVETTTRIFGSIEFGRGLRFNNPYRLATQLGQTAQSLSATASYVDLGLGVAFGAPDGLQHGGAVHASFALAGVGQAVLTPTYLLAYRGPRPFLAYGRLGPSFVLTPNATVGGEIAGGFAWFLTGKIAIAGELVFDVYYGAGTYDVGIATYPILSGQLGLLVEHEFLQ